VKRENNKMEVKRVGENETKVEDKTKEYNMLWCVNGWWLHIRSSKFQLGH
jgi:hypothetical protein